MSVDTKLKILTDHGIDIDDGVMDIIGQVDADLYEKVVHDIKILKGTNPSALQDLTVYLSTYGGDIYFGFAIFDYLKRMTGKLTIVCSGPVMSAGVLILQAADVRMMLPNSHLLIHFGTEENHNQQDKHQHGLLTSDLKSLILNRVSVKKDTVKKWFSKESYFSTKRAIEVGLIDKVLDYE